MFGFLKKKLKEAADKISEVVSGKKEKEDILPAEEILSEEEPTMEEFSEEEVEEVSRKDEPQMEEIEEFSQKVEEIEHTAIPKSVSKTKYTEEKVELEEEKPQKKTAYKVEEAEEKIDSKKPPFEKVLEIKKIRETKTIEERETKLEKKLEEKEMEIEKEAETRPKEKKSFLERIGLKKSEPGLIEKIRKRVTEKEIEGKDIDPLIEDIKISLLQSDVAVEVSEKILSDLRSALVGKSVKRGDVEKIVMESLRKSIKEILSQPQIDIFKILKEKRPLKIAFVGFNGTGKTTTIARLGYLLKEKGLKCVFAAGDTFRAAAIDQIEEHGRRLDIPVIKQKYGADPAAVIFDAVKHAESKNLDIVLADTAGRSHSNTNLIDELKKIVRVNKPDLKILIIDCLTGNDAVEQAKLFNDAVGVDALILTKADVYDKGGAVLSSTFSIKKPILYLGVGQDYEDLEKFDAEKVAKGLSS